MEIRTEIAQVQPQAANLNVYADPEVASHYGSLNYLTPCEAFLFDSYLKPGMAVLDIGVGGGRTTPHLSSRALRYVGIDYSEEMVRICRQKFPELDFIVADASDLSAFADSSFDAIVIAFNGLDYILPAEKRWQCLRECARVLQRDGVIVFSSHNPRSILVRPDWNQQNVRAVARRLVPTGRFLYGVALAALTAAKALLALMRSAFESALRILRRVSHPAFWRGEGCLMDPAHGGLLTHYWTPARAVSETTRFGFRSETVLGDDYPKCSHEFVTDWYYYVFSKTEIPVSQSCE
jgi:SAM-dependent methyltransferase